MWLFTDPAADAGVLVERRHCARCQPHQVEIVMCRQCGASVMLVSAGGGELARQWLTDHGWHQRAGDWECDQHPPVGNHSPGPEGTNDA